MQLKLQKSSQYNAKNKVLYKGYRHRAVIRELKHQAFLRTRMWGDQVETKSKTPFLAPIFVLSTRLPATDAAANLRNVNTGFLVVT